MKEANDDNVGVEWVVVEVIDREDLKKSCQILSPMESSLIGEEGGKVVGAIEGDGMEVEIE